MEVAVRLELIPLRRAKHLVSCRLIARISALILLHLRVSTSSSSSCTSSVIRSIVRMTGVAKDTIAKLLLDLGEACAEDHDRHVSNGPHTI